MAGSDKTFLAEAVESIREAKSFLDTCEVSGAEAPNTIGKITKNNTAITKSSIDKFTDCVPIRYYQIPAFVTPPGSNASAGMSGGGNYILGLLTLAVDLNANIGDTAGCFFSQDDIGIGILELSKADGGFAVQTGYEFKNCKVVAVPQNYKNFKIILVRPQNISYVENAFGVDGKKTGKAAAGSFDAATGKAAAGG